MALLERARSELDALERSVAEGDTARATRDDDDATPAKRSTTATPDPWTRAAPDDARATRAGLTVKTKTRGDGEGRRDAATTTFAEALAEELKDARGNPATPASRDVSDVPLHDAVKRADAEAVRTMVRRATEGGARREPSWPPSKAALNRIDSLGDCRSAPRGVDAKNANGDTALAVACALEDGKACEEMVKILVDAGADASALSNGMAPVHWACALGHRDALACMVDASSTSIVNLRAEDGSTPLLVAAEHGKIEVIRWLLERGDVDAMARNAHGRDVLGALGAKMRRQSQSARSELRAEIFELIPSLRLAFLSHPDCEEHVSFKPHQESPERIVAILAELQRVIDRGELAMGELDKTCTIGAAEPSDILRAHDENYVRVLAELSDRVGQTPIAFTPYCQNHNGVPEKLQKPAENSDTFFSPGTLQAALRAAGGVIHAVDRVLDGKNRSAFVCCRPPGHHAGINGATEGAPSSGFSILNNAMIGALHAIDVRKCMRVAVVDFDVHHGNGTEEIARHWLTKQRARDDYHRHKSPDLFFASIHLADDGTSSGMLPFYPGSGVQDDLMNNIVNVVVPPMWLAKGASATAHAETGERARKKTKRFADSEDAAAAPPPKTIAIEPEQQQGGRLEWMKAFRERLIPALRAFGPELIIVSAGFDAAASDVGNLGVDPRRNTRHQGANLRAEDYEDMTKLLVNVSNVCDGRVVSILEGGYGHLMSVGKSSDGAQNALTLGRDVFAKCVKAHVQALI